MIIAMNIKTILLTIIMFCVLIFVHELGHFLFARMAKVRVYEFALGMGPILLKKVKNGTQYSLRAFPIGGYCAMEGETEDGSVDTSLYEQLGEGSGVPLNQAKLWRRILITVGGPLMNLVLGFLIVLGLSAQLDSFGSNQISGFREEAVSNAQLQVGDQVIRMNNHRTRNDKDILYEMQRDRDGIMDIVVVRGGEQVLLQSVRFQMYDLGDGVTSIYPDFGVRPIARTVWGTVTNAANWTRYLARMVWGSLVDLITGRYGINQLSGPVGVSSAVGEASSYGWSNVFSLVAFISVNLGIFNMLPIPALDGGRLVFQLIEGVRRKPIPQKYEGWVHAVGFLLMIGLIIFVTFKDIINLF